jgi:pimeloyl-ACP methyl ester carboxylesterase
MPKTFINGINSYYQIHGSGSPIILIHGLGGDHSTWDSQVPEFSQSHQVIVYDLRGHGQSESPDHPYSIDLLADDLDQFIQFLGHTQVVILGLSLGGRILLRYALKYPQKLQAMILSDTQSETPAEAAYGFPILAEIVRKEGMGRAAELFLSLPLFQGLAKRNPDWWETERKRFIQTSPVGFINSLSAIAGMESLNDQLSTIQAPTLALAGEEDETYLSYLELFFQRIKGCQKGLIPQAGHMSNLENPKVFNGMVLSFLKKIERT